MKAAPSARQTGDRAAVVVVGAGITGLLTAVECALAGHRVTVLDRGPIPNPHASSFDQHRVIRTFSPDDPDATRRMTAAHRRWQDLETLLGARFRRRVGVVTARPRERLAALAASAAEAGVRVRTVEPETLPHLAFPPDSAGLLEVDGGVLLAQRALHAAARRLDGHPAVTLRPYTAVTGIDTDSGKVRLADGERLGADLVLVAAGPWTRDLVGPPVVLYRQTMVYLHPPADAARWWEHAPAAGGLGADGRAWAVPPGDGTLLKISSDAVCRTVDTTADCAAEDQEPWAERLAAAPPLTGLHRYTVAAVKPCHYAADADTGGALLARVGPAVWSRAACGGSGFSAAPLVADRIVDVLREGAA
ncbi:FAD-binding oxidoreductase [Streptomyces sp. NBC_00320]|uniref:NAD(P)/FAD-dependent oxidoreductase n=1 Tax=Streptomyces sp. NBC_00320 TaxID=2975711 RepID=UPI00224E80E3|nr:FAD-binding oxidoreductase [Streptomyces sp. NBC_00320]MCX5151087.1 FAD-binding oxidoreductase [Streptomyces sp. NBC_00320]